MEKIEIDLAEQKLKDVTLEIMKHLDRNVHIEINGENQSKSIIVKLNLTKRFK
jgi:hypothetical protein